jgi:hypothetical protein
VNIERPAATSVPARATAFAEDETAVQWPDPSPLQDWWADVMSGKFTAAADAA